MKSEGAARTQLPLALTAISLFLIVVARVCVQSITIDEADTYLLWVARADPSHWTPGSNNHILNSLLMRFFVSVFGPSNLTVRAPALIGAAIYILASYRICTLLCTGLTLKLGIFLCLVANPFVLDHLVAARGYSLALAFLMASFAVAAQAGFGQGGSRRLALTRACGLCSVLIGLSFAANFSFGLAHAASLIALFAWAYRLTAEGSGRRPRLRPTATLAAWCLIPAAAAFLVLSASAVLSWPKDDLVYGARSVAEMVSSLIDASLFTVNPYLTNPLLYGFLNHLRTFLVPLLLAAFIYHLTALLVASRRLDADGRRRLEFAGLAAGVMIASVLVHWVAFRTVGLLLPMGRTGLYIVVLLLLAVAVIATVQTASRLTRISSVFLTAAVCVLAGYFLFCLRLTYFKEWYWDADSRHLYDVVARVARANGTRAVQANWKWASVLNYYRSVSAEHPFDELVFVTAYSDDKQVYVLSFPFDEPFIKEQRLSVVYQEKFAQVAVAVRTESAPPADSVKPFRVGIRVRNLTRPGAEDFYIGDRFEVVVEGPSGEPVHLVAQHDLNASSSKTYGKTDEHGRFSIKGRMGQEHVGEWNEMWSVGPYVSRPVRFKVKPGGGAPASLHPGSG